MVKFKPSLAQFREVRYLVNKCREILEYDIISTSNHKNWFNELYNLISNKSCVPQPHEILGVDYNADPKIIKKKYKEDVPTLHPDKHSSEQAQATFYFRIVDQAKKFLID